jgi:hypothetical protein
MPEEGCSIVTSRPHQRAAGRCAAHRRPLDTIVLSGREFRLPVLMCGLGFDRSHSVSNAPCDTRPINCGQPPFACAPSADILAGALSALMLDDSSKAASKADAAPDPVLGRGV